MTKDFQKLYDAILDTGLALHIKADGGLGSAADTQLMGLIPSVKPDSFGDPAFKKEYGIKYAYVGGAMVGGISSKAMVRALAEGGALGIFGASGLAPAKVEDTVVELKQELKGKTFGSCLINTPHDPSWEEAVTEIYLRHNVNLIEASAFMQLTPLLVRYRLSGAKRNPDGTINVPNRIMAKVSRIELARRFFAPAPEKMVAEALRRGWINEAEAALAPYIPMASDLSAEADSGGHTDFRPALCLWPSIISAAREFNEKYKYETPIRVGVAGGIGTPWALLAARQAGAAYVVTGSINQSCIESGLSAPAREILAKAGQADMAQSPAADMFELGAKVQVLKFGTLYATRAQKLADAYRLYGSIDEIPAAERESIETQIFKQTLNETWAQTKSFFEGRDPAQIEKAESNPKYKMALVFRWYLGQASRWAIAGVEERRTDWQVFCGPAQGAFNEWAKGSIYENASKRKVMDLALNIMYNAAVLMRLNLVKTIGALPYDASIDLRPQPVEQIAKYL